jgi:hypothetical protein
LISIRVPQDIDGVRAAVRELCIASIGQKANHRRIEAILAADPADAQEQVAKLAGRSRLSPGYTDWVIYLIWLDEMLRRGIQFKDLTAEEADGLAALAREREEFNNDYPVCSDCEQRYRRGLQHVCPRKPRGF